MRQEAWGGLRLGNFWGDKVFFFFALAHGIMCQPTVDTTLVS